MAKAKTNRKRTPVKRIVRYRPQKNLPVQIQKTPTEVVKKSSSRGTFPDDLTFFQSIRLRLAGSNVTQPFSQHTWVYACVNSIAKNIAAVPFNLFTGDEETPKLVKEGGLYDLFQNPNPHMSRYQMWEAMMIYLELEGECVWVLEKEKGKEKDYTSMPTEIWPVSGKNFEPVIENNVFVGWKHTTTQGINFLPLSQVIFFRYFNPYSYYRGLSPIKAARMAIDQDWNATRYNLAFFENSADPGGVLIYKGRQGDDNLTNAQKKDIRESWESKHRGPGKAHRIAILENMDYVQTKVSHKDMQFLDQRKYNRDEIMAIYKVPKSEVSVYEDLNYANARSQDRNFWIKTLIPKMRYIEDVLQTHLFRHIEKGKEWGIFDTTVIEALQEDLNQKIDSGHKLWQMGYPINKVSKYLDLGLEPVPWGDEVFIPMSMLPASSLVDAKPPEPVESETEAAGEPVNKVLKRDLTFWNNYVAKILDPHEKKFYGKMKRYFFEMRSEVLRNLAKVEPKMTKLDSWELDDVLFNKDEWNKKLKNTTRPLYENIMIDSGKEFADELGGLFQFDLTDPAMLGFLNKKLIKVTGINDTVRKMLRNTLMEGIGLRETISELQGRIRTVFNFAANRSLSIARTETAQTASGTRFISMNQEGIKKHKWITAGDEHVRDSHLNAQSQGAINVGTRFINGLRYPSDIGGGAGEVINCRCVAVAVPPKEKE